MYKAQEQRLRAHEGDPNARYDPAGPRYQFRTPVLRAMWGLDLPSLEAWSTQWGGDNPRKPRWMFFENPYTHYVTKGRGATELYPELEAFDPWTSPYTKTLDEPGRTPPPSAAAASQREHEASSPWRFTAPFTQPWPVDHDQDGDVNMDVAADEGEEGRRREQTSVVPPRHNKRTRQSARLGAGEWLR